VSRNKCVQVEGDPPAATTCFPSNTVLRVSPTTAGRRLRRKERREESVRSTTTNPFFCFSLMCIFRRGGERERAGYCVKGVNCGDFSVRASHGLTSANEPSRRPPSRRSLGNDSLMDDAAS